MGNAKLVRPERFELPTYSSGGCRSIQLSYGRAADSSSVHGRCGCLNGGGEAGIPVDTRLDASLACSIAGDGQAPSLRIIRQLSAFDGGHRTPLPLVRLQNLLAQPQRFWRDLDELIVGNELNRLLEIEIAIRNQANRFVGS
jgi:hypothetical protein